MPVFRREGAEIVAECLGHGPAIVLLPNYGRRVADFDRLAAALRRAGYQTIGINGRGAGGSEGHLQAITLHDLAVDVAMVLDGFGIEAAHLIGHAFGNRVSRCFAADFPNRTRSVTLLSAGGKHPPDEEAFRTALTFLAGELPGNEPLPDRERRAAVQAVWFTSRTDGSIWLEGWHPTQIMAFNAASEATPVGEWWLAGVAPLLCIQGLEDKIARPVNAYDLKKDVGGRLDLVELADTAHALLPEAPDRIETEVLRFLLGREE